MRINVDTLKGKTIAFAASGGLDSCTITRWLTENGVNVVCITADMAQHDEADFDAIRQRMLACGAKEFVVAPLRDAIAEAGLDIIQAQPRFVGNPYVFAGRNGGPTAMFGSGTYKSAFDNLCGVTGWRVHDARRTARSLMSRAKVQTEIAEMVLGHAREELLETYDRHLYEDEKAAALEKLTALIERIVA